jgi:hypothetical protein
MHTSENSIFSQAVTFIEFEKSGNPQEKYRPGTDLLAMFMAESEKSGKYTSYIDQVLTETTKRFDELKKEIELFSRATFKLSLEHSDPEAYQRMRMLEALEEEDDYY